MLHRPISPHGIKCGMGLVAATTGPDAIGIQECDDHNGTGIGSLIRMVTIRADLPGRASRPKICP